MNDIKITERGWAGHFICADRCKFRRNTLIECGKKKVIVSTVGAMFVEEKLEEIGLDRHYETMCFKAKKTGKYWDADVERKIEFNSKWYIENVSNNSDNEANKMHENVVKEIVSKMKGV